MSTAQFRDAREEARGADESADAVSIDEEAAFAPLHEPGWSVLEALVL